MKTCRDCNTQKPIEDFPSNGKSKAARCRPCKQVYDRNYYKANKLKLADQRKIKRKAAFDKVCEVIDTYLINNPCSKCGEKDIVVLEFDHRDPKTKKYNIADMPSSSLSIKTVLAEIAKCDVLCANCHRRKTAKQFGHRKVLYSTGATLADIAEQFNCLEDIANTFETLTDVHMEIIPSNPTNQWIQRNV